MILNGVIASILHYFTEFDRLGGRLCHSGWRYKVRCRISSSYILAKTDPRSSRTVFFQYILACCCLAPFIAQY